MVVFSSKLTKIVNFSIHVFQVLVLNIKTVKYFSIYLFY